MIKIANAPCSWGVLEFDLEGEAAGFAQVLNEMVETGYAGTELGDWGFMPTDPEKLAEEIHSLGPSAVIVTGGHGTEPLDWLYDGEQHLPIPVERHGTGATHGAGCTHSASLTALLARGESVEDAARGAARIASEAVRAGLAELGSGSGPVDVFDLEAVRSR